MNRFFIIIIICFLTNSCSREESTWDVDLIGPAAQAEFYISDIIPDSILTTDPENNLVLSFNSEFLNLKADTLLSLTDTTFGDAFTIPPPFSSLQILPGLPFPASLSNINLNPGNEIEIKKATICTGHISVQMINPLETSLIVTYLIPGLTTNDDFFYIEETLLPADEGIPSVTELFFDISDYEVDLTGASGLSENNLAQSISIINSLDGDTVLATLMDTLKFNLDLIDLTFSYAKGYIGSFDIAQQSAYNLDNNLGLHSDNILLNEASIDLEILNGMGIDFRIADSDYNSINSSESISLTIDNDALSQNININRAIDSEDGPIYSSKIIHLDETNSNITEIIALAPDSFSTQMNLEINPLGNSSSSNDFVYKNDGVVINAKVEIPLCLSVNELQLTDSLSFDFDDNLEGVLDHGELIIYAENSFPFNIEVDLSILESNLVDSEVLIENKIINACEVIGTTCEETNTEIVVNLNSNHLEQLRLGGLLLINGVFNSTGEIKLTPAQNLKLQAVVDAKINVGL